MKTVPSPFLSVSAVNSLLKYKIENDDDLRSLNVQGEISSWKRYPNAVYFDLKDDKSVLSCMMWGDAAIYLPFEPKVGDLVLAEGDLSVYVPRGRYSLIVRNLSLAGQGSALLALEALKKKLQAEGLFDESRKREIPSFPAKIGIIVGQDSAAKADLLKNLQRRWPLSDLYFFPSLVQGKEAPKDLLLAFEASQKQPLDVLIIARGGGSNEDLSAFNDETLVRAFAHSVMPTISAVGHEVDTTLIDFVSDLRVSTPTGAAEAATPNQDDIRSLLADSALRLSTASDHLIQKYADEVAAFASRPFFKDPASLYRDKIKDLGDLSGRMLRGIDHLLSLKQERLQSLKGSLRALNPSGVLSRGYSITRGKDGKILTSAQAVAPGDSLQTQLADGVIDSKVIERRIKP